MSRATPPSRATSGTAELAPSVFTVVLGFALLLILFAFRSIVIAIKAILLNLQSVVVAAYGSW